MYLIVNKEDKVFLASGNQLDHMSNGYPRLIEENIAFVKEMVDVFEVASVDVEPYKYCYTESDGFYINPNWVEPDSSNTYGIDDNLYHQIIDDYTDALIEEGAL